MYNEKKEINETYTLIIPKGFTKTEIIERLNSMNKNYEYRFSSGFSDDYSVWVNESFKELSTTYNIKHKYIGNKAYISITQNFDIINNNGKEELQGVCFFDDILRKFEGVLIVERKENYKKVSTKYLINYKEESLEYKLLTHFIENKHIDILYSLFMVFNIIEDKDIIKELIL